ncbi:MAG: FmdB family zinc ribbon protein [Aequoribacter sp.]|uniref:FmdB family zinc ribbon protein n=1 Tax=Aequoribacter sp. TaxID=2847771 RepID=UPI003C482B05
MPLYQYRCTSCADECSEFNTVADRHANAPKCACGGPMVMRIMPVQVQAQILGGGTHPGYHCPVSGEYVTSRKQRRNIMAEHNLIEAGDKNSASNHGERMLANTNGTRVST